MTTGIDKAIRNEINRLKDTVFKNGVLETTNRIYEMVEERLNDNISQESDPEIREKIAAIKNGVLADITDASDEVVEEHGV